MCGWGRRPLSYPRGGRWRRGKAINGMGDVGGVGEEKVRMEGKGISSDVPRYWVRTRRGGCAVE